MIISRRSGHRTIKILGACLENINVRRWRFRADAISEADRSIQHLKGFRALGADVDIEHGKIVAEAEQPDGNTFLF